MDSLHYKISSAHSRHATWTAYNETFTQQIPLISTRTAYISTFTLEIPAFLQGQPIFHHLLCRFRPFYNDRLYFNIYSADSRHATWIAYISTFTLRINVMLHEQPTRQHLLSTLLPCYMDSLNFNSSSTH